MIDYQVPAARARPSIGSDVAAEPGTSVPPKETGLSSRSDAAGPAVVSELARLVDWLTGMPPATGDSERIDRIAVLEQLRGAVAAAQARETVAFAASQIASQAAAGVPVARRGRGVAEQVGLARRMSPASAARQVTLAEAWHLDLPAVFDVLRRGETSEWSATLVVRETNGLDRHTRRRIAEELAPDLPTWSPREVEAAARRMAYEADPEAVMARGRTARSDRRVGLRPAPDTMSVLSAFLPAEQGVATWANLDRHARTLRATGDPRSLGQLMADTLVERVTGQATASAIPVEIGITMTADSLLSPDTDQTPAELDGYGPIPADLALDLATQAAQCMETAIPRPGSLATAELGWSATPELNSSGALSGEDVQVAVWVRRLFTDPVDETVVHVDTKRRRFDGRLARLIRYRDRVCRDLFCTAPIRHLDHVNPHRDGGPTTAGNGAGLCERGNYVKDMPGWSRSTALGSPRADDTHAPDDEHASDDTLAPYVERTQRIEVTTPTGHRYTSKPPPALGPAGNYRERRRRTALRRIAYLEREYLIASLPSPAATSATDRRTSEPP